MFFRVSNLVCAVYVDDMSTVLMISSILLSTK